jgi:hypothetical protein
MAIDLNNPEYWRFQAEEARSIADSLEHEEPKKIMNDVALAFCAAHVCF